MLLPCLKTRVSASLRKMNDYSYIGENIRTYLRLRGINQSDLARMTGTNPTVISDWICGRKLPTIKMLDRIANALDVGLDDLVVKEPGNLSGEVGINQACKDLYNDLFDDLFGPLPDNCEALVDSVMDEMLTDREREVLVSRYGLDGAERKSLDKIAKDMDISRERVRQIHEKDLEKMRKRRYVLLPGDKPDSRNEPVFSRYSSTDEKSWADRVLIEDLNLSARSMNALLRENIFTLGQLLKLSDTDISSIPGLGSKGTSEVNRLKHTVWAYKDEGAKVLDMI